MQSRTSRATPAAAALANLEDLVTATTPRRRRITTLSAVRAEIEQLEEKSPGISQKPEAAAALALARRIDSKDAVSLSSVTRVLRETMEQLRGQVSTGEVDLVSELGRKRAERLAAAAGGAGA